ncbi:hypothetical protein FM120_31475 [Sphingobacterium faecium PCAi_F2.5]|nr:hypothetical protein FM120_31475 [Sphingobacterium faecium PCAi_F2.5]
MEKSAWAKFIDALINKKLEGLAKLLVDIVTLFDTKRKATIQVIVIGVIVYLYFENKDLNKDVINEVKLSKDSEVRIYKNLIERFDPQFQKIQQAVDSSNLQTDSVRNEIKPLVNKLKDKLNLN